MLILNILKVKNYLFDVTNTKEFISVNCDVTIHSLK